MTKMPLALLLALLLALMLTGCPDGKLPKEPPMVPTPKAEPST